MESSPHVGQIHSSSRFNSPTDGAIVLAERLSSHSGSPSILTHQLSTFKLQFPEDALEEVHVNLTDLISLQEATREPEHEGGFYRRLFAPENVVILVNSTGCLNDVCRNLYGEGHDIRCSGSCTRGSSLFIGHPQLATGSCASPVENFDSLIAWRRRKGGQPMWGFSIYQD